MPTRNLKQLRTIAKQYNSTLPKPIRVSQKKSSLEADLHTRKVSLESKGSALKSMVKKANNKASNFAKVAADAKRRKQAGPERHLDNVIDNLEQRHQKKKKKKKKKKKNKTPASHTMPDGTQMSGKTHSPNSNPTGAQPKVNFLGVFGKKKKKKT